MKNESTKVFTDYIWEKLSGKKLSATELNEMNTNALRLKEFLEQELLEQKRAALQKEVSKIDEQLTEMKANAVFNK